jgi:L-fuconolactonase
MRIDSHQHFWRYDPGQYGWISDEMAALRRDFLPSDLSPLLKAAGIDGTVAVQARETLEETEWLLDLAKQHDFIRGVVGWVDLCAENVREPLRRYAGRRKFKGVRHIVEAVPDVEFLLRPAFRRGIRALAEFGLTYDLLLRPVHLPVAAKLVREFPDQRFVVDHMGKPPIRDAAISPWREDMASLARFDNVYCKLSGMATEAHWRRWKPTDFTPYLDVIMRCFGDDRVMVGSDWPVCTLSADYRSAMAIVIDYVEKMPATAQDKIFHDNCSRFYRL